MQLQPHPACLSILARSCRVREGSESVLLAFHLQGVRWSNDTVDNENMGKKKSKSESAW